MVKRYISLLLNSSLYIVMTSCVAVSYKEHSPILPPRGKRGMMEKADMKKGACFEEAHRSFCFIAYSLSLILPLSFAEKP